MKPAISKDLNAVIIRPRITEKASTLAAKNIYTFEVSKGANSAQVARAVKELYKVEPIAVNILPIPSKTVFSRGKIGVKSGGRKAYVELKDGDKIEFV